MEDRIQINGEWYVKESTTESQPIELDLSYFLSCIHETKNYVFEAMRTYDDFEKGKFFSNFLDIEFTDKRTKPWKIDNWDGVDWFRAIYGNDKSAVDEALEVMDEEGVKQLKAFIKELINKGWITYE